MSRIITAILLTVCLVAPSLTEAHQANPWVAGLITPMWYMINLPFQLIGPPGFTEAALIAFATTVPGVGHIYAGSFKEGVVIAGVWFIGLVESFFAMELWTETHVYAGLLMMVSAICYDIFHAPIAAKRHNEKHAREKEESAGIVVIPALTLLPKYDSVRVGVEILF